MVRITLLILYLWIFLSNISEAVAQKRVYYLNLVSNSPKAKIKYQNLHTDTLSALRELKSQISILHFEGFLTADIKNYSWENDTLSVRIDVGDRFKGFFLENGNLSKDFINESYIRNIITRKNQIQLTDLKKIYQWILNYYEDQGYPFASIYLDSLTQDERNFTAKLFIEPNQKISIDTLRLVGDAKINRGFLYAYLGFKEAQPYEERKIKSIDKKLNELNFVTAARSSEVVFSGDKAKINIFLNKQNANQFDGILGFLPNATTGKLQLTGDFKLKLKNALRRGETLDFNYRGLPSASQELNTRINYPYIFNSSLGVDFSFQLFKRDTSFLNLNSKLLFDYYFNNHKKIGFFVENYRGNSTGSTNLPNSNLPEIATVSSNFYGLNASYFSLDDRVTPLKGLELTVDASVGNRNIKPSDNFDPKDFNLDKDFLQYKIISDIKFYLKTSQRSTILLKQNSSFISGSTLFFNEGFRIGGNRSLRGFDEQSILASSYFTQTAEFRYLIEKNSFINLFVDQSFVQQNFRESSKSISPMGFGAGLTFQTKVGIASLSYALGLQENNPVDLQKGKIHFGIVSYF